MSIAAVLAGERNWACVASDVLEFLNALPDDSVDLLFTSPPYLEARTYGIGAGRKLDDWVAWMTAVVTLASRKVRGLVAVNCEGQTRNYRYLPAPFLLAADLHRAGLNLRKPVVFHRVGVPGSGGPDWLRNDWEPVVCVTRPGKLPWSDPTALGHPPKWAPGGEMSHRLGDGTRRNQWGMNGTQNRRKPTGERQPMTAPSHVVTTKRKGTRGYVNGDIAEGLYTSPVKANPGNVIKCKVGGGQLGHPMAHSNEAPFPLKLAEFFVLSFCPPNGVVCDPFSGSGTTAHASVMHGRRFVGADVRESQVALCARRLAGVTPSLLSGIATVERDAAIPPANFLDTGGVTAQDVTI